MAGGHIGKDKTLHKLRERFYWPGHQKDVKVWCRTCKDCAAMKTPVSKRRAPLTPITSDDRYRFLGSIGRN